MSTKDPTATRAACFQTNGEGGTPAHLVDTWSHSIKSLRLDIFGLCETRLSPAWKHRYIESLFRSYGLNVISHNREVPSDPSLPGPYSSGVLLGISSDISGGFSHIHKDTFGRAIAASIPSGISGTLRVIVVYGPTAASAPRFSSSPQGLKEERDLVRFISDETEVAYRLNIPVLVLGDLNSFPSISLDCLGGNYVLREASVAVSLACLGAIDSFRYRHPELKAYSYVHSNGTASRLDQIWFLPHPSSPVSILRAALLDDSQFRRDHLIPLLDLSCSPPSVPAPPVAHRSWNFLSPILEDDSKRSELISSIAEKVSDNRTAFDRLQAEISRQSLALNSVSSDSISHHNEFAKLMRKCLPPPRILRNRSRPSMIKWAWASQELARLLRAISSHAQESTLQSLTARAIKSWSSAYDLHLQSPPSTSANAFPGARVEGSLDWATDQASRRSSLFPAWVSSPSSSLPPPRPPPPIVPTSSWVSALLRGPASPNAIRLLANLAKTLSHQSQQRLRNANLWIRRKKLRRGIIKPWARLIKESAPSQKGYSPDWWFDRHGTKKRPHTRREILCGAEQEWSSLLHNPREPWNHPFITKWTDTRGVPRGSLNLSSISLATPGSMSYRVGEAALGSPDCGFILIPISPHTIVLDSALSLIVIGEWYLGWSCQHILTASRQLPLNFGFPVIFINGLPPDGLDYRSLTLSLSSSRGCGAIAFRGHSFWGDLTRPTSPEERKALSKKGATSAPGISGWKSCFVPLFPTDIQDTHWTSLDIQRSTSHIDPDLGFIRQVHLDKPVGVRPICLAELSLKAIEGLLALRKSQARASLPPDSIYSSSNLCGDIGKLAAQTAMYGDILTIEDALLHGRSIGRLTHDEVKFFNVIQRSAIDAIEEARGVPEPARASLQAVLHLLRVHIDTRWGISSPIPSLRGALQGLGCAPEASKPGQDTKLRMRMSSPAFYVTHYGRKVSCMAYADDGRHYTGGASDLPSVNKELAAGSQFSANAANPAKSWAYASDWDSYHSTPTGLRDGFSADGISVQAYDIYSGLETSGTIPRATLDTEDVFLGKGGSLADRHIAPASKLLAKIFSTLHTLRWKHAAWDEVSTVMQWKGRGFINYCPLAGVPSPVELHIADRSIQASVLLALRVRPSSERASLYSSFSSGGLQLPCLVESMVSAVAKELSDLLNGNSPASDLARDSLRFAMSAHPVTPNIEQGLVCRALRFLAAYGIYPTVSTDKTVGRILDELHATRGLRSLSLLGPFNSAEERIGLSYCRVGKIANGTRQLVSLLRSSSAHRLTWHLSPLLRRSKALSGIASSKMKEAIRLACMASHRDWLSELSIFQPPSSLGPFPPEDWSPDCWSLPLDPSNDRRSALLDRASPTHFEHDAILVSDGGEHPLHGCTYAAEVRSFGQNDDYHNSSYPLCAPITGRLPSRYGYESCNIHAAEVIGGLIALRWRRVGSYNLLVVDRSSFFGILHRSHLPTHKRNKGTLAPLEARLHRILLQLENSWHPPRVLPSWLQHLHAHPDAWNKRGPFGPDQIIKTLSKVAYNRGGTIGIDIKSHQVEPPFHPTPALAQSNASVDRLCALARPLPAPCDVRQPSSPLFCNLSYRGYMIMADPLRAVRSFLRNQAVARQRRIQIHGKISRLGKEAFLRTLEPSILSCVLIPPEWRIFCLPADIPGDIDLYPALYRISRSIGGCWTEVQHSDSAIKQLALAWSARESRHPRCCPLCHLSTGDSRHATLACQYTKPYRDLLLDKMELLLVSFASVDVHRTAAADFRSAGPRLLPSFPPSAYESVRWPILSAWGWLVTNHAHEELLRVNSTDSSVPRVANEITNDLSYRAIIPSAIARTILGNSNLDNLPDEDTECYATDASEEHIAHDLDALRLRHRIIGPAIQVQLLLTLGIRRIRFEYMERIRSWIAMQPPVPSLPDAPAIVPPVAPVRRLAPLPLSVRIQTWASSPAASREVKVMRALLLSSAEANTRFSSFNTGRASHDRIASIVQSIGIPIRASNTIVEDPYSLRWADIRDYWLLKCPCSPPHSPPGLCDSCGRPSPSRAVSSSAPCYLCNRSDSNMSSCHLCGSSFHFQPHCAIGHGVHRLYRSYFSLGGLLCPECVCILSRRTSLSVVSCDAREEVFRRQRLASVATRAARIGAASPSSAAASVAAPVATGAAPIVAAPSSSTAASVAAPSASSPIITPRRLSQHHHFRSLVRLIRSSARDPYPMSTSTCPQHLRDTLHTSIRHGRILAAPCGRLSLP